MKRKITDVTMALFVAMMLALVGCGGGGGGGGGGDIINPNYKGATNKATVTASNAKALSVDAIEGVQSAASVDVLGKRTAGTPEHAARIQTIARIITASISRITPRAVVAKTVVEAVQQTEYGYSGSYSFSGNANQTTGAISGTITFSSYKELSDSPTISGIISFTGTADTATGGMISATMSFTNVTVVLGAESSTLNGSMSISVTGTANTLNISLVLLDNVNNNTYWVKDFSFVVTGGTMTISGTYYDHQYGYVVVTTAAPLAVSTYSDTPTAGQLLFTGNNGTKARLTYAAAGYTLEVDASGNNTYVVLP